MLHTNTNWIKKFLFRKKRKRNSTISKRTYTSTLRSPLSTRGNRVPRYISHLGEGALKLCKMLGDLCSASERMIIAYIRILKTNERIRHNMKFDRKFSRVKFVPSPTDIQNAIIIRISHNVFLYLNHTTSTNFRPIEFVREYLKNTWYKN